MPPLPSELRNQLASTVAKAREVAVEAASAALKRLTIEPTKSADYLTTGERALRTRLRAKAQQLGDERSDAGVQSTRRLTHEVAYEHWHRMLFARFLAENGLLRHPKYGGSVTLADCAELAEADGTPGVDRWDIAERFAAAMLPQIFRPDDAALAVRLAPEHRQAMERFLEAIPALTFTADSLGWVYQFWQSAEKDRVNAGVKGGDKITGETLPAVTQLFTEHYMVLFLLHNTIGAWHAARQMAKLPKGHMAKWETEADARAAVDLPGYAFDYLRFVKDEPTSTWRPAAGTFDGWTKTAKELKVLDPCCGSGHFLVAALELLMRLRMAEEGLDAHAAAAAVIADNLFGLELDARCTQIAAFNVALAAWKFSQEHFDVPELHIACSGLGPSATLDQWLKLADKDSKAWAGPPAIPKHARQAVTNGLTNLHRLFSKAPELGSLIDPSELRAGGELFSADWETMQPFLKAALAQEKDADAIERAVAAQGMAKAAEILSGEYTLVITNVPYLGRGGQGDAIKAFCEKEYPEAKADLATVFVSRILRWLGDTGTTAVVTPQNWLFLTSYKKLRERLLKERTWNMVVRMGEHAFESSAAAGAFAAMMVISGGKPAKDAVMAGIDVSAPRGQRPIYAAEKAALLRGEGAGGAAGGAETADLQAGGNTFQAAGNALQAGGNTLQATGSTLQPDRSTIQTGGSALQADGRPLQPDERPLRTTRRPADLVHGAPARDARGQSAAHGAQQTADRGPAMAPPPAASPESGEGPEDQTPADVASEAGPADGSIKLVPQAEQLKNPDARVTFDAASSVALLAVAASTSTGMQTFDKPHFTRQFWEVDAALLDGNQVWKFCQTASPERQSFAGRCDVVMWERGDGELSRYMDALRTQGYTSGIWRAGSQFWGQQGVAVSLMGELASSLYSGDAFDTGVGVLIPTSPTDLHALWAFASSTDFNTAVRRVDQKLMVTNATLGKVPFDLAHWQKVAAEKYPGGLPEPQSDDPTQWLFHGHPAKAEAAAVLQVAVARLVGYRWPAEHDQTMRLAPEARARVEKCKELERFADDDGVVPLHATSREGSASDRLGAFLAAAFEEAGASYDTAELIRATGSKAATLAQWLKEDFANQHNALFHHRPFVWQIWDGKKDGFSVLVHYHRLAAGDGQGRKLLEKIAFTYLGDYISDAGAAKNDPTAESRKAAAAILQGKLQAILTGDPPYDLFTRWKPLHQQPIGWEPDINDGVRINIRPFIEAGVLKGKINVKWDKDRGKEPRSLRPRADFPWFWSFPGDAKETPMDFGGGGVFDGVRWNNVHYSRKAKDRARAEPAQ
jgi:hypothetical protein